MRNCTLLIGLLLFCFQIKAQVNYEKNTIVVQGSAEMEVIPNKVDIQITLKEVKQSRQIISINQARSQFLSICKTSGIADKDISIDNIWAHAAFRKLSKQKMKKDMVREQFTYNVSFEDFNKLETLLDRLNVPWLQSIKLAKADHTDIQKYRKEVKEQAMVAALDKAAYLSRAAKQAVGKVIYIEEIATPLFQNPNPISNSFFMNKNPYQVGQANYEDKYHTQFKPIMLRYQIKLVCALN